MGVSGASAPFRCRKKAVSVIALALSILFHAIALIGLPSWPTRPATHLAPPPSVAVQFLVPSQPPAPKPSTPVQKKFSLPPPPPVTPALEETPSTEQPILQTENGETPSPETSATESDTPAPSSETSQLTESEQAVSPDESIEEEASLSTPSTASNVPVPPSTITLAYHVSWKNLNGEATYVLWNDGKNYRINFLAKGTGIAGFFGASMEMHSEGRIAPDGLHPERFWKQEARREEVRFLQPEDGSSLSIIFNNGTQRSIPSHSRAFDPLSLVLQFYFDPPSSSTREVWMATPLNIYASHLKRETAEQLEVQGHKLDVEVWADYNSAGKLQRKLWLAPRYYYMPVQIHDYTNGTKTLRLHRLDTELIHT